MIKATGSAGLAVLLVLAATGLGDEQEPTRERGVLPLGRETTFITEPLNEDGTPNYVAWLNEKHSEGITPENNAAVPLVRVFGPEFFADEVRDEVLKGLGIDEMPDDAGLFRSASDYLGESFSRDDYDEVLTGPWSRSEYPDMARWLDANEQAFALLEQASRRSRYHVPLVSITDPPRILDVRLVGLGSVREAARAMTARAMLHIGEGDYEAAWADAMTVMRLGRLHQDAPTLIGFLVGLAVERIGSRPAIAVVAEGDLAAAQLREFQAEFRELRPTPEFSRFINYSERFMMLDSVVSLYRGPGDAEDCEHGLTDRQWAFVRRGTYWGEVLKPINEWFGKKVVALSKPTYGERKEALDAFNREFEEMSDRQEGFNLLDSSLPYRWAARAMTGTVTREYSRRIGLGVVVTIMSALDRAAEFRDRLSMGRELTDVAIGLAIFNVERGEYPDRLDELTPEYLDSMPEDLFVNEPLRYRRTDDGYLLYSVGPSMTDHGGSDDSQQGHDDIVIRVPLPAPEGPKGQEAF